MEYFLQASLCVVKLLEENILYIYLQLIGFQVILHIKPEIIDWNFEVSVTFGVHAYWHLLNDTS